MKRYQYQPIILIGAARSGTKLVRDLIGAHPNVDKVPYDITYIWRMGNEAVPHDELGVELLTPQIRDRIVRKISAFSSGAPFLVEKTVENSVRVPYIQAVFPDARFIQLMRDGRDVVESVYREWTSSPDWGYIFKKALTYPILDAFGYATSYASSALRKVVTPDRTKTTDTWGARYKGIVEDLESRELLEVCAIQWVRSVELSRSALSCLPAGQVLTIRYEAFVQSPEAHLNRIAEFAGLDPQSYAHLPALKEVSRQNIGKGFRCLDASQQALVMAHLQPTLASLEYV
jgi:hypothetical protein